MSNPPAFQLYAADFYMDTISWTSEEVGCYFRLLMTEWVNGPIKFNAKYLQNICQISSHKWPKIWQIIAEKFVLNGDGHLINVRLEKTREKHLNYIERQKEPGLRGAEKKRKLGLYPFDKSKGSLDQPLNNSPRVEQALLSSSSINTNIPKKEHFILPTKEEVNESAIPKIKEDLNKICEHLYETKKFLKVYAFKNKMLKQGKNERAILHTLVRCSLKDKFEDSPWGFCIKIIQVEDGNYNEYEYGKDKN